MKGFAVITGASSGLGAAFARRLARDGYSLLLVARRRERLEKLAEELDSTFGAGVEVLVADLTREADLVRIEERLRSKSELEFLVNNAGFGTLGRFFEITAESQDSMHRLHVIAPMRLTHAALPGMISRRKGSVVNVSSLAAFSQSPGNVSYCSTKAWMNSFTEGLYVELRSIASPVRVQALCPGFILTEFHDTLGVDRSIAPQSWWMKAEDVVAASMAGLETRKLIVIPGRRYRLLATLLSLTPRSLRHRMVLRRYSRWESGLKGHGDDHSVRRP